MRSSWMLTVIISRQDGGVNKNQGKKEKKYPSCSLSPSLPVSLIDWLTDLYCHSSWADSDLYTYITLYVLGWIAATCMNSAWGGRPRVCVSQITFTRRCSSRLPASAPSRYHIKGSGCGLIQSLERQSGLGMHDWCWVCNIRYHKVQYRR